MAVENDEGANAEEGIHRESLGGVEADSHEAVPGATADGAASGKAGEEAGREQDGVGDGAGGDDGGGHGHGLRDDRDDVHGDVLISFRGRESRGVVAGEFLDSESLGEEQAIEGGQTETATAVEKVGDVRLSQSGLACEQRPAQNSSVDATPDFQTKTLM